MNVKKLVVMAVVAALLVGIAPLASFAGDDSMAKPAIRGSIDRVVAKTVTDNRQPGVAPSRAPRRAAAGQAIAGGGGGKTMAVVALLSTVAGLATTYYVVKQMRKQTGQ